jgi:hypothetical protein
MTSVGKIPLLIRAWRFLERLRQSGMPVLRTDKNGAIHTFGGWEEIRDNLPRRESDQCESQFRDAVSAR